MTSDLSNKLKLAQYLERLRTVNKKWKPHPKQGEIIKSIFSDGCKRVFIQAGRKFGKALDIRTPILTTEGFKELKDVHPGDYVFGRDGKPKLVQAETEVQYERPCYKVLFKNGSHLIADEQHEWVIEGPKGSESIFTTKDLASWKPRTKPKIRKPEPIEYESQELEKLPIQPYLLGLWLGDGDSCNGRITTADPEVFEQMYEDEISKHLAPLEYGVMGLTARLRGLDLIKNKHIPPEYFKASVLSRLEVLRGLMDSDGTIEPCGRCTFFNSNYKLICNVADLLSSLGEYYKFSVRKRDKGKTEFYLRFRPRHQVSNLKRKAERVENKIYRHENQILRIKSVIQVTSVPVKCIQVEDSIFLAGRELIPTHNSELCNYICWRKACEKENAAVYIIGPTRKQQTEIMWANGRLPNFAKELGTESFESQARVKFPWGSFIKLDGSENYEDYRGTEYDVMIFDEFKDCDFRFYEAVYPNLLARDGLLVVIGTPPDSHNHYVKLKEEIEADPDWMFFHGTSWDNPHLPGGKLWLTKEKQKYYARGDGAIWEREYEAKFVPGGANAVFPMFSRQRHTRDYDVLSAEIGKDMKKLQWYVVCDPGTTTVFAVAFIAYNPYTSQIFILDEIYEKDRFKTSTIQIWERVKKTKTLLAPKINHADWYHIYDEAAAWFQSEMSLHYGVALTPTTKKGSVKEAQISLIKDSLARIDGVVIASQCENMISEIENYVAQDSLNKRRDHLIDCFRYFMDASNYSFDVDAEYHKPEDTPRIYSVERDMREMNNRLNPLDSVFDMMDDEWII